MYLVPEKIIKLKVGKSLDTLNINVKIIPDKLIATKDIANYIKKGERVKPCAKIGIDGTPKGITIHNTNNIKTSPDTNPAEQYTRATYNGNMSGVVVHYYVYEKNIWQLLDNSEQGWHASDGTSRSIGKRGDKIGGNLDTIAIESIADNKISEDTTAKLAAYLCHKYGFDPLKDIYTHNYWMHGEDKIIQSAAKNCPYYIIPNWSEFLSKVKSYLNEISSDSKKDDMPISTSEYTVKQGDSFWRIADTQLGSGSRYKEILELNRLDSNSVILAGQKLKIPSSTLQVSVPPKFKVGDKVKLAKSAKNYYNSDIKIPLWVSSLQSHTILQVKTDCVLLQEIYSWVSINDIILVK